MTIITTPIATQAGHWYKRDTGEPAYTIIGKNGKERNTTLRDARAYNLVPSVTTILKCADKPGLNNWKMNQVLLSALTLKRADGEGDNDFMQRIMIDAAEQGKKAAERGTQIHAWIEKGLCWETVIQIPDEAYQFVALADKELAPLSQKWNHEKSFATGTYGGKVDLSSPEFVIDIKTNEKQVSDAKMWDEHFMQLAAYREGLCLNSAQCGILFINHKDMESKLILATEDQISRGWDMFSALVDYYYAKTGL